MSTSPTMLYGLAVSADFPLFLRHRPPTPGAPDVAFVRGPTIAPTDEDPEGQHLVRHEVAPGIHATHVRRPDGSYLMRFARTADFHISADTRVVTMCLAEGVDADFGSVLAMGTVMSFVLLLRGSCVLHASAVEFDEQVVAFVGYSGMGKSTMAALMCADGGRLVTDDVLHVDLRSSTPTCHLGATELRLRKAAAELAERFDGEVGRRTTSDLRDALALPPCPTEGLPLAGVVIPRPRPDAQRVDVTRLGAKEAMISLLRFPRIVGIVDPAIQSEQFAHVADLVARVPVYVVDVPWGPPFPEGVARDVLGGLGLRGALAEGGLAEGGLAERQGLPQHVGVALRAGALDANG